MKKAKGDDQLTPPMVMGGMMIAPAKDEFLTVSGIYQPHLQRVRCIWVASPIKTQVIVSGQIQRRVKVATYLGPVAICDTYIAL
jgi:hypothetical protein